MSFSGQAKKEMSEQMPQNPCCVGAGCYGIACFAKVFGTQGLVLRTERAFIAQWAKVLFSAAGIDGKVYVRGEESGSYEFSVDNPYEAEKMLAMFGHSGDEPALRIQRENLLCEGCVGAFASAAFLAAGTVVNPEKGYNLEFVSPRTKMIQDFADILREHNFTPGLTKRKGVNVLYFRSSEQIEDLLTLMGAPQCTLELMNQKVYRDFRNRANRITNCETANIDKIVAANRKTLDAIRVLEERHVLQSMPQPLQEAAALRRDHPDYSLTELIPLFEEPVSKASLNRRFQKIREKANEYAQEPAIEESLERNPHGDR